MTEWSGIKYCVGTRRGSLQQFLYSKPGLQLSTDDFEKFNIDNMVRIKIETGNGG